MRRCGVCFVAVQGSVEAVGLVYLGVLHAGSRLGRLGTVESGAAFSAADDVLASGTITCR